MCKLVHFERMVEEALSSAPAGADFATAQQAVRDHVHVETGVDMPLSNMARAMVLRAVAGAQVSSAQANSTR